MHTCTNNTSKHMGINNNTCMQHASTTKQLHQQAQHCQPSGCGCQLRRSPQLLRRRSGAGLVQSRGCKAVAMLKSRMSTIIYHSLLLLVQQATLLTATN
jgi:hypothetical protein